jgi:diguanylate cyclase (GGDEF)-like protein
MQEMQIKIGFVVLACSLSWSAAAYFAYGSRILLRYQRTSSRSFRNFFILFGFSFLGFAIATIEMNFLTVFINCSLYLTSLFYLKQGFASFGGSNKKITDKLNKEYFLLLFLITILNPIVFTLLYDSWVIRTSIMIPVAIYYCLTCLNYLEENDSNPGVKMSRVSIRICIYLLLLILSVMIITDSIFMYLSTLMIAQCVFILLVFGSTLVLFLGDATNQFKKEAATDYLTGLFNRRYLNKRLNEDVTAAKRHAMNISIVVFDLDNFKMINDRYGHDAGDEVLKTVSKVILEVIRDSDIAARMGGEEFCLVLPYTDLNAASLLSERLRLKIESSTTTYLDNEIKITSSFGISQVDLKNATGLSMINADKAMYRAKSNGRNQIKVHSLDDTQIFN